MIRDISIAQPGDQLGNHRDVFPMHEKSAETFLAAQRSGEAPWSDYFSRFFTLQHRPGRRVSFVILVVGL